ncbi:MAG: LLM class flavin-dependent oxidoreductase [Ktedonobacteraceae bacterium]|jgi:F420-dependent oxidoreductase-like protein
MPNEENTQQVSTASSLSSTSHSSARARIGLAIEKREAMAAISAIADAEAAGVEQVWMTQSPPTLDTLTLFAAAATRTKHIRMGTSIVPTYPRHPLVLAQQALTVSDLAPGRLRLGVGPSHRPSIEGVYGLQQTAPLAHLSEYVAVLRAALWEGRVDYHGNYFNVTATLPRTASIPILISALREGAFHLAGEIADGAISWLCPVPYLLNKALPALRAGARARGRPTPPLVAHILVALNEDEKVAQDAARKRIQYYTALPFYARMFADAGFPVTPDGTGLEALARSLVVYGNEAAIARQLTELLAQGLDELLVLLVPVQDASHELGQLVRLIGSM